MARRPRRELPDGLAHVTCRTVRRFPLFRTERDALALLELLQYVTREVAEWKVLAYCLMPNHVHYVVDAEIEQQIKFSGGCNAANLAAVKPPVAA